MHRDPIVIPANLHRPAIDPLFRSAALSAGRRVIAVVLTGMLDDGTSGLMVVKAHGGIPIVQDPQSAMFSAMPRNALEQVPEAQVLPLEAIPAELVRLVREEIPVPQESAAHPGSLEDKETRLLEMEMPQLAEQYRDRANNTEQNARVLREFLVHVHEGADEAAD